MLNGYILEVHIPIDKKTFYQKNFTFNFLYNLVPRNIYHILTTFSLIQISIYILIRRIYTLIRIYIYITQIGDKYPNKVNYLK